MVWPPSVKGILVTESVRGDGGVLTQLRGQAVHVRLRPGRLQGPVRRVRGRGRPLVRRPGEQPAAPRAAAPRRGRPRHQLRGQGRPRLTPRRRLPRRVDAAARPRSSAASCPSMYHQFKELADVDITAEPMEVGPDLSLRDGRCRGRPRHGRVDRARAVRRRARSPAACTARTGSAATRLSDLLVFGRRAGLGASALRRRARRGRARPKVSDADVAAAAAAALAPFEAGRGGRDENPYTLHQELQQTMNDLVGIIRRGRRDRGGAAAARGPQGARASRRRRGAPPVQPRLAPGARPAEHAHRLRVRGAAALERQESRGGHTRDDYPDDEPRSGAR